MPQLNLKVGIRTIGLEGPETSRDKLLEIYLEVYKLHRLPGSPLGELAIAQEVLAAVPDCHQRGGEAPEAQAQPSPGHSHPSNRRRPTGNKKAQWIEVLPRCEKLTNRHYLPQQPWRKKLKG